MLSRFVKTGRLEIIDAGGKTHVFAGGDGPRATIRLKDPKLYRALFLNPELRTGEAYMDGRLVFEEGTIRDLLMIYALNRTNLRTQPFQKTLHRAYKRVRRLHQRNPGAVAAGKDIGLAAGVDNFEPPGFDKPAQHGRKQTHGGFNPYAWPMCRTLGPGPRQSTGKCVQARQGAH